MVGLEFDGKQNAEFRREGGHWRQSTGSENDRTGSGTQLGENLQITIDISVRKWHENRCACPYNDDYHCCVIDNGVAIVVSLLLLFHSLFLLLSYHRYCCRFHLAKYNC